MSFQMRLGLQVNDTLAPLPCMPDHWNYLSTQFRSCWQLEQPLAMRHVSSAYCRMLVDRELLENL